MDENINLPLMKEIMALHFSVIETVLYLNTHPRDEAVINLHNNFARRQMALEEEYQERYGPIHPGYPDATCPWRWIDEPWPWQIDYHTF